MIGPALDRWLRRVELPALRATVRAPIYRRLWALAALAYVVISLFVGQMVQVFLQSTALDSLAPQVTYVTDPSLVASPYLVPAVILTAPHLVVILAFWPTVVMVLLGVGIGLAVASTAATFLSARRRDPDLAASGAAPVVTGWALLGACCCTGCAAQVAAVTVVGSAVGSSPGYLLRNSWPLGLLQIVLVGLSLLYMERKLEGGTACVPTPTSTPRLLGSVALRVGLLVAGVTWVFAFFVEASEVTAVPASLVYHWALEHWLLGGFAIAAGLAPDGLWSWTLGHPRSFLALRGSLIVAALTWAVWVPPALAHWGLGGFLNELFGYLGFPARWGATSPDAPLGAALYFHWAFQHLLLGAFALSAALVPASAFSLVSPAERPTALGGAALPALPVATVAPKTP